MRLLALVLIVGAVAACGGPAAPMATPPPGAVVVVAQGTAFATHDVTAPANTAFTLFLENKDNEPHNVRLWNAAGESVFPGEIIQGPATKAESVPALAPGSYRMSCDIHPEMTGQLITE